VTARRALLACGVASPVLYAAADAVAGWRTPGYSFRDHTISELGAIGAPSRLVFSLLLVGVYVLLTAFGLGVRRAAAGRARVRRVGTLVVALGLLALTVGQVAAMRPRGTAQGLAGALHAGEGAVAMALLFAAMGVAAGAFGPGFRGYTIVTVAVVVFLGGWSVRDALQVEAGAPTPWLGVRERIFWYAYQLWFAVLALRLLQERDAVRGHGGTVAASVPRS
jgi:hypothetical protein